MLHLVNNPNPLIPWRISVWRTTTTIEVRERFTHRESSFPSAISVRFTGLQVKAARLPLQDVDLEI